MLAPSSAIAQPKEPIVDNDAKDKSRAAFRKGVSQLRAQDWAGARASFETAWSLFPHPSILLNLGIARLRTDDPVLAEQDLVRFLSEDSGAAADELAGAREALAEARARIGTLRVIATPASARVSVDGSPISERMSTPEKGAVAEVRLKAGRHAVVVEADGFFSDRRAVDVVAKSETEIKIALGAKDAPAPTPVEPEGPSLRKITGYSLAGLAGVALVTSGISALRAKSLSDDYGDQGNPSTFRNEDVKSEGIAFRTAADVALGIGVLAAAGAVVLLFTDIGAKPTVSNAGRGVVLRW